MATIPFEPWPHLIELLDVFLNNRFIIIGKARQLGISTLVAAYCTWRAKFYENVKVLMLSQGQVEAFDLLFKAKFIDDHLPDFLRGRPRNPDQQGLIRFPDTGSEIVALPSTEKAGRSTDATIVVSDELEYHEYAEVNFGAIRPTISAGGQYIGLSTANPLVTQDRSFFKRMYVEDNGFKKVFLSWDVRPGRDEKWLKEETRGMPSWQAAGEYPSTEEDMLATLKTMPFFDNDVLKLWLSDCLPELMIPEKLRVHKTVHVWKLPVVGRRYAVFTDPSDGKEDPHATLVKDLQSGEIVALSHGKVPADYVAQIHHDLVLEYNKAFNSFERNATAGGIFYQKQVDLETPNRCGFIKPDGKILPDRKWQATSQKSRDDMIQSAEEYVRLQKGRIYYSPMIKELMAFYRPEGDRPQAPKGGHDDFVIALGGLERISKHAHSGKVEAWSGKYRG